MKVDKKELVLSRIDVLIWDIKNNNDTIERNKAQNKELKEQILLFKKELAEQQKLLAEL